VEVLKYLVEEAGADESRAGRYGQTPLMWAANKGQTDVMAYLLGRPGVDLDTEADNGDRAIDVACLSGHLEVLKLLLTAGAKYDPQASNELEAFLSAALAGHLEVVKYLVEEAGADANRAGPGGCTPLICAADKGHTDVVAYLLGRPGIDINAKADHGKAALDLACGSGRLDVVKLLVAAGARVDPQADEVGALAAAALKGHLEVVKYLVEEARADASRVGPDGFTPLMCAASKDRTDVVAYLEGIIAHKVSLSQVVWSCTGHIRL
jgi:ankyrin repeat protein